MGILIDIGSSFILFHTLIRVFYVVMYLGVGRRQRGRVVKALAC